MAHRFNVKNNRVEPKPSASERTWYRWRVRNGLERKEDIERKNTLEKIKEEIRERLLAKLRNKKDKERDNVLS